MYYVIYYRDLIASLIRQNKQYSFFYSNSIREILIYNITTI